MAIGRGEAPDRGVDVGAWCECGAGGTGQRGEREPGVQVASRFGEGRAGRSCPGIDSIASGHVVGIERDFYRGAREWHEGAADGGRCDPH